MEPATGKLLVATPRLADPIFGNSLVFLTSYGSEIGAQGFILNGRIVGFCALGDMAHIEPPSDLDHTDEDGNPSPYAQAQLQEFMGSVIQQAEKEPIRMGGPCQSPIFALHGHDDLHVTDNKRLLIPGVLFGLPPDIISIVENVLPERRRLLFFMGMAGWFPGQLETEIESGAWVVQDAADNLSEAVWKPETLRESIGTRWTSRPPFSDPSLN